MITIKQFNKEDVGYIIRWFSNENNRKFQKTKKIDLKGAYKLIASSDDKIVYCILLDDQPIGYAMLKGLPEKASVGITIDEPFWGKGYGFEVMKLVEVEAKKRGCRKISLLVHKDNQRALSLYKKLGYSDTDLKLLEKDI